MADIDNFANEIFRALLDYEEEADNKMQKQIDKKAKEIQKALKTHPNIPVETGDYKKSFKIKKAAQGRGYKRVKVYAGNGEHTLTHLLEYGHLTRNGGRTRAFPHWRDAQKMADELFNEIQEALAK